MRVLRARALGMCFGVRDAVALALEHAEAGPLTILGDLVHNPTVLSALEASGVASHSMTRAGMPLRTASSVWRARRSARTRPSRQSASRSFPPPEAT